jgi:hypothetical protein
LFSAVWVPLLASPAVNSRVFGASLLGKPTVAPFFNRLLGQGNALGRRKNKKTNRPKGPKVPYIAIRRFSVHSREITIGIER